MAGVLRCRSSQNGKRVASLLQRFAQQEGADNMFSALRHQSKRFSTAQNSLISNHVKAPWNPSLPLRHTLSSNSSKIFVATFRSSGALQSTASDRLVGSATRRLMEIGRSMRVANGSLLVVGGEEFLRSSGLWKSMWGHWVERRWVPQLPPLARILGITTWACSRSHIVPRGLAVLLGEATWGRKVAHSFASAEAYTPSAGISRKTGWQPIITAFQASFELLILWWRAMYLLVLFTPAIVSGPFADMMGGRFRQKWLQLVHYSLESAGAAFIKWGQWAATRPDLFPKDMCDELSRLHTKAPAHNFEHTKKTVEGAFGRKLTDIFDDFEDEPVASGSIAQVHRAVLKRRYPGVQTEPQLVAVKVRHPGVSEVIRRDFVIINWIAKLSSFLPATRWLRLEDSVQQFATFMMTQVDLAREAAQLSRFIYNFRRWKDVSFPKPVYPLVHPEVLVETFEQGESVTRYVERPGKDHIDTELAHLGSHTLLKMLLVDNFIHADLHPGNILVRVQRQPKSPTGVLRGHPHVVLLDVGMTAELSPKDRSTMLEFFKAVAIRDGKKAAECTLQFTRQQNCPNPERFVREVDAAFRVWDARGGRVPTGECIQELLEQVRRHRVNIDGDVCTVMITTLVLEGWQRKLDPDLSVMDTLHSILFKSDWAADLSYTIDGLMSP